MLLYTRRKREWTWGDEEIVARTLATGDERVLLQDTADARYVPTGHLVFLRRGVLFAVAFDAERLEKLGAPMPVLEQVAQALSEGNSDNTTGAGQFAFSSAATLAWVPGPVAPRPEKELVTVDLRGHVSPLSALARTYGGPSVSPDGRRLAATVSVVTQVNLFQNWFEELKAKVPAAK